MSSGSAPSRMHEKPFEGPHPATVPVSSCSVLERTTWCGGAWTGTGHMLSWDMLVGQPTHLCCAVLHHLTELQVYTLSSPVVLTVPSHAYHGRGQSRNRCPTKMGVHVRACIWSAVLLKGLQPMV